MLRPAFFLVLAFALQGAQAQQVGSHGVPASVLSPTSPGTAHGTPASVNSPSPQGRRIFVDPRRFRVRFGGPRPRHERDRRDFAPVPIFIPAYPINGDYSFSEPEAEPSDQNAPGDADTESPGALDTDALREAYNRGAHDALAQQRADSRYGEHYLDSREKSQSSPFTSKTKATAKDAEKDAEPQNDADASETQEPPADLPATVFIFKDGHKLETQNYAIQGQTLFDFSNNQLRKIKLADLDLDATRKANDELGINVRLPSAP